MWRIPCVVWHFNYHGHMLIENVFRSLKNWWCAFWIISIVELIKVGKSLWHVKFFIIFVNYWTCMNQWCVMLIKKGNPLVAFHGQWTLAYRENDAMKRAREMVCNMPFTLWLDHNPIDNLIIYYIIYTTLDSI